MTSERTPDEAQRNDEGPANPLLDEANKVIIQQLQENGRRSYVSIGRSVGLSEAAVRSRVQRLTEAGVIQIVAVTDPLQLGFTRQAMIGVTINGSGDLESILENLKKIYNVDYIVVTAGRFDILVEVFGSSDDELLSIVTQMRSIGGIDRTEIFTYLKLAVQRYDFGVR
ncbi:Lrp/AsnC family transcriptional regulator [uncultured Bifidobacterium sp.]|uniref:Lrp/AsnC family transcriptional regulator n=1 Tax=uncultured Bifidobacterium sp. TaxID=165187 RepID=UPI0028DC51EE|nr:Lrp/AsnC family transcriptional regulator [uncultured Bifidobacterium sp.]